MLDVTLENEDGEKVHYHRSEHVAETNDGELIEIQYIPEAREGSRKEYFNVERWRIVAVYSIESEE